MLTEQAQDLQQALFKAIWNLGRLPSGTVSPLTNFYLARISIIDQQILAVKTHRNVADIVDFVRQRKGKKRNEIAHDIATAKPRWLGQPTLAEYEAIDLAIRLWLLVDPECVQNGDATIVDQIALQFRKSTKPVGSLKEFESHFNLDFLRKVAGITIIGTSSLTEHLLYDKRRKVLMLFDLLEFLKGPRGPEEENTYPPGFLKETEKTLALLRSESRAQSDYTRSRHSYFDAEMQMYEDYSDLHDPNTYSYWRDRLLILHEVYQESQPSKLAQFWQDRRDINQWTTLWLAVLVIFLTLVFGLIQSITGILQLLIAYRQFQQQQPITTPS